MKIYAAFPDTLHNSMAIHDMPYDTLVKLGVTCEKQERFFATTINDIKEDDLVILWIGSRDEGRLSAFSNLKCRKVLRNIDSCSSDRVLFKRELEIYDRLGLECLLVAYCTDYNMSFLAQRGIKAVRYPHMLDFAKFGKIEAEKKFDIFISGHLSQKSYPLRHKLANFFFDREEKYRVGYLPHPGYRLNDISHNVFGQDYIDLASSAYLSIVCTGDDDSLVVKYLEFAAALTLPLGDAPSNMPSEAKDQMALVSKEMSEKELESLIDEILNDKQNLYKRTVEYRICMQKNFDTEKTSNILNKIVDKSYDNV